jgi:predicted nucleic acid-binding protein
MEPLGAAVVTDFEAIIEKCAGQAPPALLRTLDAMHLAAATVAGEVELVATDRRLREAALTLGFRVYPPP